MNIAVFGASGHIGKNLIYYLKDEPDLKIFCFSRSSDKLNNFLLSVNADNCILSSYDEFPHSKYDAIINCIGIGDPASLKTAKDQIFRLTEYYDNLILDNLKINNSTVYINISSGAVYGTEFKVPVDMSLISSIDVNNITARDHYRISKLNSEVKHRALSELNIFDLRVFGFFSRFLDIETEFLLCEILKSIINERVFITGDENIIRDYIHPQDFVTIIKKCISISDMNIAFDICSKSPVSKLELLNFYKGKYNLKYKVDSKRSYSSVTGSKLNYYSLNNNIAFLDFQPKFSSLECIDSETSALLNSLIH